MEEYVKLASSSEGILIKIIFLNCRGICGCLEGGPRLSRIFRTALASMLAVRFAGIL